MSLQVLILAMAFAAPPSSTPPPAPETPAPPPPPPPPEVTKQDLKALQDEIDGLKKQVATTQEQATATEKARSELQQHLAEQEKARQAAEQPPGRGVTLIPGIVLGGYIQSQYENHQDSTDQLMQNGALFNRDRFVVPRAHLKASGDFQYAGYVLELEGYTNTGYNFDVNQAAAILHYRPELTKPPLLEFAIGVIYQPFGWELLESSRDIPWMERSTVTRALFAGPQDVGARLGGNWRAFHWTLALMNGEPFGEKSGFPAQDPSGNKDAFVRVGFDTGPGKVGFSGNVSALKGRGFHPGTSATKGTVAWRDDNEDGLIQLSELQPVPGLAATPSLGFDRSAEGIDLEAWINWPIGPTSFYGAVVLGKNMDRNLFVVDPIVAGNAIQQFGWYVGAVQQIGTYVLVGFRYDYYDPDSSVFDSRGGHLFKTSEAIGTASPLIGLQLPDRARLSFQYDFIHDHMGRDKEGLPADLSNNAWTLRLQVQL